MKNKTCAMINSVILTRESLRRPNFKPNEFFASDKAKMLGVDNYPSSSEEIAILTALMSTADMMQEIRELLGTPIDINSAYRCKLVNDAVGSKDTSQHRLGLACDFTSSKFGTPEEIMIFLHKNKFLADQCFCEGSWIHISRALTKQAFGINPNRAMYGYYLPDEITGERKFKPL